MSGDGIPGSRSLGCALAAFLLEYLSSFVTRLSEVMSDGILVYIVLGNSLTIG